MTAGAPGTATGPPADPELLRHRALGLTDGEAAAIEGILGRSPNDVELAMYGVMWSEHCSYKSSRRLLGTLPSEAPWVLVGPGENAGVVDVGDGLAVALRIESHNHPSAIEPHQGAATGAGGILRDIFTMGARPMALLDSLHVGPLDDARSRWILDGVVSGIAGYGNSVGVPTVGGELASAECFRENPLVNVACLGVLRHDRLVLARASGPGNLAVLLGSTTGRDGIGGVSVLASAGFEGEGALDEAKRPSVQVGDPYEEKRLIEACLALYDAGLVVAIQDLGGAGLCCATSETASRGGVGMDVDVTAVPRREPGMTPAEVMTSESQERMLAIVAPGDLEAVLAIARRWEVRATVVGRVTTGDRLRVRRGLDGPVVADVPAATLHDDAPRYDRPQAVPEDRAERMADGAGRLPAPPDCGRDLLDLLAGTAWVSSQYDHELFGNTVVGPGGDAALLRLRVPGLHEPGDEGPRRAVAVTVDSNSRWCAVDPRDGTRLVVAEAVLNLACVGARPLAIVNCLNFGDPGHPEVMWQLAGCVDGLAEASRAFAAPVVGGNVSLYNASAGRDIDPTPVVAVLGVVDELRARPPGPTLVAGGEVWVLGPPPARADLSGSAWADRHHRHRGGRLAPLDVEAHGAVAALVRELVAGDLLAGAHDVGDGGLGVAMAEMVAASGVGATLGGVGDHAELFGEAPSRVVACVAPHRRDEVRARAAAAGVAVAELGPSGGERLVVGELVDLAVEDVVARHRGALGERMAAAG